MIETYYHPLTRQRLKATSEAKRRVLIRAGFVPVEESEPEQVTNVTPDDLTKVKGIGAKRAAELNAKGVMTYQQLADYDTERLHVLMEATLPTIKRWQAEARKLA
jgi:predicted flap endonuclease-1-like 5' DNA nuclease